MVARKGASSAEKVLPTSSSSLLVSSRSARFLTRRCFLPPFADDEGTDEVAPEAGEIGEGAPFADCGGAGGLLTPSAEGFGARASAGAAGAGVAGAEEARRCAPPAGAPAVPADGGKPPAASAAGGGGEAAEAPDFGLAGDFGFAGGAIKMKPHRGLAAAAGPPAAVQPVAEPTAEGAAAEEPLSERRPRARPP